MPSASAGRSSSAARTVRHAEPRAFRPGQALQGQDPIFDAFGIEPQIEKTFERKVWLKKGGYICIDHAAGYAANRVEEGPRAHEGVRGERAGPGRDDAPARAELAAALLHRGLPHVRRPRQGPEQRDHAGEARARHAARLGARRQAVRTQATGSPVRRCSMTDESRYSGASALITSSALG